MESLQPSKVTFSHLLSRNDPDSAFLHRDAGVTASCRQILKHTFAEQTSVTGGLLFALGPISQLHVSKHFAYDQLWQQLELRNKSLLSDVRRQLRAVCGKNGSHKIDTGVRFASNTHLKGQVAAEASTDILAPKTNAEEETVTEQTPKFFNEADMNAFADDAENLAERGKLIESDDDSGASDGIADNESDKRPHYSDFFDSPVEQPGASCLLKTEKAAELLSKIEPSRSSTDHIEELTPLQGAMAHSKPLMEEIENQLVKPKPWQLRGEVSAFARPKESLLDTEIQHDVALRPSTMVQSDVNQEIENIIKQRIIDDLFDDVTLAPPSGYKSAGNKANSSKSQLPDVSQEKAKEGLADLYAREFTEQQENEKRRILASTTVERQEDDPETDAQKEVNNLYEALADKLDSLSNLHFTPSGETKKQDLAVSKPNVKAIMNEEAIPEGVSDGDVLAPHEVFNAAKISSKGDVEMTKLERKAKRRANKVRNRKAQVTTSVLDKSSSHFDGVTTDKRRAHIALERVSKKVRVSSSTSKLEAANAPAAVSRVIDGAKYEPQNEDEFRGTASSLRL